MDSFSTMWGLTHDLLFQSDGWFSQGLLFVLTQIVTLDSHLLQVNYSLRVWYTLSPRLFRHLLLILFVGLIWYV